MWEANSWCPRWWEAVSVSGGRGASWISKLKDVREGGGSRSSAERQSHDPIFLFIISLFLSLIKLDLLGGGLGRGAGGCWVWQQLRQKEKPVLHQVKSFLSEEGLLWEALILYFTFFLWSDSGAKVEIPPKAMAWQLPFGRTRVIYPHLFLAQNCITPKQVGGGQLRAQQGLGETQPTEIWVN